MIPFMIFTTLALGRSHVTATHQNKPNENLRYRVTKKLLDILLDIAEIKDIYMTLF